MNYYCKLALKIYVGLSLCVYFFFLMLPQVDSPRRYDLNYFNAIIYTCLSSQPVVAPHYDMFKNYPIFATRVPGPMLAGAFYDQPHDPQIWHNYKFDARAITFGIYQSLWLGLLFGLLIYYREDSVFLMLGTFAGMMYNLTLPSSSFWFPWDMPIMCLFTWAILVFLNGEYFPLLAVAFLASAFKETGLVLGILILLGPWSWKRRIFGSIGLFIAFVATRKFLMYASGANTILLPLNEALDAHSLVVQAIHQCGFNLQSIFFGHLNSPWFINGGLLFIMLLLPARAAIKLMVAAFLAGQLIAGTFIEYRDFYEVLPLGFMQASEYLLPDKIKVRT